MEEKCPVCGLSLSQKANKKKGKEVKGREGDKRRKNVPFIRNAGRDSGLRLIKK